MKKSINLLCSSFAMGLMLVSAGCTTTDVVGPPSDCEDLGEKITLSINCPEAAAGTRAGNDHVLRYSAIMYAGESIDGVDFAQRKEVIASDEGATIITFEVPEGTYSFVVIGDYIPMVSQDGVMVNPRPDENGFYQDAYYDTHSENTRIWAISHKNNKGPGAGFFNNDNYDCFAKSVKVTKGPNVENKPIELTRIVSRIGFVSSTSLMSEIDNITITDFDYFPYCTYINKTTGTQHANCSDYTMPKLTIPSVYDEESMELFYFYTLAPKDASEGLYPMSITVNFKDNTSRTLTTPDRKITPIANTKIKVSGPFLSEPPVELGPINLLVTTNHNWGNDKNIKVE